jgi:SWI/SNF-related matrix-associated actin-dependent regulator 1 of chromatin subfamily A
MDRVKAEDTGLTLSTNTAGPNGELIYYTADPYAALNYYKDADDRVKGQLAALWNDYEMSWATDSINTYPMGNGIILRPDQNAAVDYALAKFETNNGILVGDAPGIGKTYTAIGIANAVDARRILVVCPAAIRRQWRDNIKVASTLDKVRVYPIIRSSDGAASWPNYTVISYDLLRNPSLHAALCSFEWDLVILDEAHLLKEINARRTQAIFGGGRREEYARNPLAKHVKRIVALTGTPLVNRPRECYTLSRALSWESIDYMSEDSFRCRYNPSARMSSGYIREERGRLPELQARLRCNFMVRRLKEDVLKNLPDKTYEFAYIEKDGSISDVVRKESMLNYELDDLRKPSFQIMGEISTIRREMGEAKIPQTIAHIEFLLDVMEIEKIVVFSHHHSVMEGLKAGLAKYGVVEYRGGMSDNAKQDAVRQFAGDSKKGLLPNPKVRIFSGQLEASGVGIDGLQEVSSYVVIVEPAWTSGANEQAIDRLHRNGQKAAVIAQFIVVEGSLDEKILAAVINKTHNIFAALDNRKAPR